MRSPVTILREIISVTFSSAISSQRCSRTAAVVTLIPRDSSGRPAAGAGRQPFSLVKAGDYSTRRGLNRTPADRSRMLYFQGFVGPPAVVRGSWPAAPRLERTVPQHERIGGQQRHE